MKTMPRGRKPSVLKQQTDTKLDGAYTDLQAIPDDPEFGGRKIQESIIDATKQGGEPMVIPQTQSAYQPADILSLPTENIEESGLQDSDPQEEVTLLPGSDTDVLIDLIKEASPAARLRF